MIHELINDVFALLSSAVMGLFGSTIQSVDYLAGATSNLVAVQRTSSCAGFLVATNRVPAANEFKHAVGLSLQATIPEVCPVSVVGIADPTYYAFQFGVKSTGAAWKCVKRSGDAIHECWRERPGCATVAKPTAPGMSGIRPASCISFVDPVTKLQQFSRISSNRSAVARLVYETGETAGTATLIDGNFLLTTNHTFSEIRKVKVRVAQFKYFLGEGLDPKDSRPKMRRKFCLDDTERAPKVSDFSDNFDEDRFTCKALEPDTLPDERISFGADDDGKPPRFENIIEYELETEKVGAAIQPKLYAHSPDHELDYAIVRILCNEALKNCPVNLGIQPIRLEKNDAPSMASALHLFGFTDNVFFPRGMILSTNGAIENSNRIECQGAGFCYSNQTTFGFSGGPVFDNSFRLLGIHTESLKYGPVLRLDSSGECQLSSPSGTWGPLVDCSNVAGANFRFAFELPSRGILLNSIITDLEKKGLREGYSLRVLK